MFRPYHYRNVLYCCYTFNVLNFFKIYIFLYLCILFSSLDNDSAPAAAVIAAASSVAETTYSPSQSNSEQPIFYWYKEQSSEQ